eukprot:sb/3462623/
MKGRCKQTVCVWRGRDRHREMERDRKRETERQRKGDEKKEQCQGTCAHAQFYPQIMSIKCTREWWEYLQDLVEHDDNTAVQKSTRQSCKVDYYKLKLPSGNVKFVVVVVVLFLFFCFFVFVFYFSNLNITFYYYFFLNFVFISVIPYFLIWPIYTTIEGERERDPTGSGLGGFNPTLTWDLTAPCGSGACSGPREIDRERKQERKQERNSERVERDPKVIEHFKAVCVGGDEGNKDEIQVSDKCFTIVVTESYTVQQFYHFFVNNKKDCERFVNDLFALTHHFINVNLSQMDFVRKMYTRLKCSTKVDKHISIKDIVKAIAKDEKRKVLEALRSSGLKPQDKKNDTIEKSKFTFEAFYKFYNVMLGTRTDIEKVFGDIKEGKRNYLTIDQMVDFLNKYQRDPRLNEILFPFHSGDGTKKLIKQHEKDKNKSKIGQLTLEGFHNYLMSADCLPTNIMNLGLYQSMNEPLSHYFINSSHNTYLTGDQFGSKSSVEMYRQSLLAGCRCVELDCWDGEDNEPHITHGFTLCSNIHFKDVIVAINETAFKTSSYPVILSFENHCTPRQQQKMAHYCIDIFGDKLLKEPLDEPRAQLKKGCMLPSPEMLKYKILIKNKKRKDDMPDQQDKEDEKKEEETTALSGTGIYLDGVEPPAENIEDEAKAGRLVRRVYMILSERDLSNYLHVLYIYRVVHTARPPYS